MYTQTMTCDTPSCRNAHSTTEIETTRENATREAFYARLVATGWLFKGRMAACPDHNPFHQITSAS